jgi:dolichol-phosphate mannosyltransferase
MPKSKMDISVVVPVYNEEKSITPFMERLIPTLNSISPKYEVIFCLDPSTDGTERLILEHAQANSRIKMLKFSRRFGQGAATFAGLKFSSGAACAIIDVDLQDPPELIIQLFEKHLEGFDVVNAKRISRDGETRLKKAIASFGYLVINKLSEIDIPRDTGDFRIMSRRVVDQLSDLNEANNFLRGLVAYIGYNQTYVTYARDKRYQGVGKYNRFTGSVKIGLNGLIGFSAKPLWIMSMFGIVVTTFAVLLGLWYLYQKLTGADIQTGLTTTVVLICFLSGIQLLSLGLIGEYISRIFDSVRNRPTFIIDYSSNFVHETSRKSGNRKLPKPDTDRSKT